MRDLKERLNLERVDLSANFTAKRLKFRAKFKNLQKNSNFFANF